MPEDDMSEDEFKGYLDDDDLTAGGDNSHDPSDDVHDSSMNSPQLDDGAECTPIPDFEQPVGCAENMTGASPLQFFQQMVTRDAREDCRTDQPLCTTVHGKQQSPPTFQSTRLEQSNV